MSLVNYHSKHFPEDDLHKMWHIVLERKCAARFQGAVLKRFSFVRPISYNKSILNRHNSTSALYQQGILPLI